MIDITRNGDLLFLIGALNTGLDHGEAVKLALKMLRTAREIEIEEIMRAPKHGGAG